MVNFILCELHFNYKRPKLAYSPGSLRDFWKPKRWGASGGRLGANGGVTGARALYGGHCWRGCGQGS